jgi:hypothetical protein
MSTRQSYFLTDLIGTRYMAGNKKNTREGDNPLQGRLSFNSGPAGYTHFQLVGLGAVSWV